MPLEHPNQYGHLLDPVQKRKAEEVRARHDKREDEEVAANRAALDKRLEKRAAEITAEDNGPLLDPADQQTRATRYRLSDGTDISRMTVDQIRIAQARLSPAFPNIAEALKRRQRAREARMYFFWAAAGILTALVLLLVKVAS